jgi:DNA helicase HerA-like ATPase
VVRLIRSKGVGVYFCSQFPDDVPGEILGQLGNRFQHALRAFTPRDQKAVKTAAETFVANPGLDVARTIGQLGVGEALVSTLQDKGIPMPVEKTLIAPPRCRMGPVTEAERAQVRAGSPVGMKYDTRIDRDSAAEMLAKKAEAKAEQAQAPQARADAGDVQGGGIGGALHDFLFGSTGPRGGKRDGVVQQVARNEARRLGTRVLRGVLGGIFGGKR